MLRRLQHFIEAPRACSYLSSEVAALEHQFLVDATAHDLDSLLAHGFRRFGPDHFRPACPHCSACVPTRILVNEFIPSKSQRRIRRKAERLDLSIGLPKVDAERLRLYAAWHEEREQAREWAPTALDERAYFYQFAFPHPAAREVAYHDPEAGGRLVGIGICDETPRAWSLAYFFYDPAYRNRSLGVANVVICVELAARRSLQYVYLGYRVAACPSLRYKASFNPREELMNRPQPYEAPRWVRSPAGS